MRFLRILLAAMLLLLMAACNRAIEADIPDIVYHSEPELPAQPSSGQIHLYGEWHALEHMIDKHFELWYYYYNTHGMRHLILETSFSAAEFLNIWMHEDDDDILDALFRDRRGTASDTVYQREFYRRVKRELPETIFHGVDVGHQYASTGRRFLRHLRANDLEGSEIYRLATENIAQGREFYGVQRSDHNWRTVVMANNFIRVFDGLGDESVMGQFGGFHVNTPESRINPMTTRNMIAVLKERYGENVHTTCLVEYFLRQVAGTPDVVMVGGTEFNATFYGEQSLSAFHNIPYVMREFWLLTDENAYDIFKDHPTTGNVLPFHNFPMRVEAGQVAVIRYILPDDTYRMEYLRSDGEIWYYWEIFNTFVMP
ncbi:MAG: hypothetical protein LBE35_11000 [Clostridiales bacterium]|jgi:hypothetical protein|nr:hypothetical protein [Clostridiales bacterium]